MEIVAFIRRGIERKIANAEATYDFWLDLKCQPGQYCLFKKEIDAHLFTWGLEIDNLENMREAI